MIWWAWLLIGVVAGIVLTLGGFLALVALIDSQVPPGSRFEVSKRS